MKLKSKSGAPEKRAAKKQMTKISDYAWSLGVKRIASFCCEYCGSTEGLESHHVFGRRIKSIRHYLPNGVCLCKVHHDVAHKHPAIFLGRMKEERGLTWWNDLNEKSNHRKVVYV